MTKKKKGSRNLIIVFVILLAAVVANYFYQKHKTVGNFKSVLVQLDTAKVSGFSVFPKVSKYKEVKLTRQSQGLWKVQQGNQSFRANINNVKNVLGNFADLKPEKLAGKGKSDWKKLNVGDSSVAYIEFHQKGKPDVTVYIGHFTYNRFSRSGGYFVRVKGDPKVYSVSGYLPMFINKGYNNWRYNKLTDGHSEKWTKIALTKQDSSVFVLQKDSNRWKINGKPADSSKTASYLMTLSRLQSSSFDDSFKPQGSPEYSLVISGNISEPIVLNAYKVDSTTYEIHSSANKNAYFKDMKFQLGKRVFIQPSKLVAEKKKAK